MWWEQGMLQKFLKTDVFSMLYRQAIAAQVHVARYCKQQRSEMRAMSLGEMDLWLEEVTALVERENK